MLKFNARILVVEDFPTMRRIIKNTLRQLGYDNIKEVEDGSFGLAALKAEPFDLVISDWNMPKMTGLELLQKMRTDEELKHIPFLMITAEGQKENILTAARSGVSNYIVKPFTPHILKDKLELIFP
ncbi:MAG: chemotaxis response regulator CheY [Deltaproteobacteria bacterium]|nr:chemotaxis response regulator CheY [Deltaproteobacteria bacterium]